VTEGVAGERGASLSVEPYDPDLHADLIRGWCRAHGVSDTMLRFLPEEGFVVDRVCAGFLYQTDARVALLEGFISDRYADTDRRDLALDRLGDELFALARERGHQQVWIYTQQEALAHRAEKHGAKLSKGRYFLAVKQL
jgi:hypothetical protein